MASSSRSASGVPLRGQAREIVYNVHTYFQTLKETHNLKDVNINNMTSEALAVSCGTDRGELKVTMEREASFQFVSVLSSAETAIDKTEDNGQADSSQEEVVNRKNFNPYMAFY